MKYRQFYSKSTFELYATGDSNWDLYWMHTPGYASSLVCLAKEGSGASDSCWGPVDHIAKLERRGIHHGFTLHRQEVSA